VDERATAPVVESFYKLKASMSRGDALAATQQDFHKHAVAAW
jgi:hypothetical protein